MVRVVLAVARAGRALLAATVDASSVGEATLTARLVAAHPDLFTPNDVYVCDRNFFGSLTESTGWLSGTDVKGWAWRARHRAARC